MTGLLILTSAVILLIYWFRYACTLALGAKTEPRSIARVAAVNGLSFLLVAAKLRNPNVKLDEVASALDRDYRKLRLLLVHAGDGLTPLEQRMLHCDYHLMRIWYRSVRRFSPSRARKALEERSRVLTCLAWRMGQSGAAAPYAAPAVQFHPHRRLL
jgi:hypothetical protein